MERNNRIDISKGIAIVLMILGHSIVLTGNWTNIIYKLIFSFHMPLFIIFSGYFFSGKCGHNFKLIKPYIITAVTGCVILSIFSFDDAIRYAKGCVVGTVGSPVSNISFYTWQAGPMWFLLALFWCRIYFYMIYKHFYKLWLEVSIILGVLFILICYHLINIPLCIGAGVTFLIFYSIGFLLKSIGIDNIKHRKLIYLFWIASLSWTTLNTAQYSYDILPLSIVSAVCGTITIYDLSGQLKEYLAKFMAFLGMNTLPILCCHTVAWATKNSILTYLGYDKTDILLNDITFVSLTILYIIIYAIIQYCISFYKKLVPRAL